MPARDQSPSPLKRYSVMVRAEAFLLQFEGEDQPTKCGFYTGVFVMAANRDKALSQALDFIKRDEKIASLLVHPAGGKVRLTVEKVTELAEPPDCKLPRTGLSFYPLD